MNRKQNQVVRIHSEKRLETKKKMRQRKGIAKKERTQMKNNRNTDNASGCVCDCVLHTIIEVSFGVVCNGNEIEPK